jgi:hypothetical protein
MINWESNSASVHPCGKVVVVTATAVVVVAGVVELVVVVGAVVVAVGPGAVDGAGEEPAGRVDV